MADYNMLAVLSTGKPGVVNTTNFVKVPKLKVTDTLDVTNNITVGGTVDGVDIATRDGVLTTLDTNFSTHDGGTALAQHSAIGDHTHASAGAQGGTIDHGDTTGKGDDDHTQYSKADGTRAFTGNVSGITPTSAAHLTRKDYVDGLVQGLKSFKSVVVRATGNVSIATAPATIDGVNMAGGDRCLLDQQSTSTEDGVYVWNSVGNPMTRATDVPTGTAFAAAYLFVKEGITNADTGFVCTNDDGSDVIGTHDIIMTEFSRAAAYTGGDGIDVTTTVISVDLATNPALQFTSNKLDLKIEASTGLTKTASGLAGVVDTAKGLELGATGFGINVEATTPSLAVVSTELGIKFDANGGLQKAAGGTGIKLSGTTLQLAAGGVSVKGVGSLFEVATVAVSADVTAANLTELTGGGTTSLHTHTFGAHKDSHKSGGGDAFAKGDSLIASAQYLDDIADPASDAQRIWIEDATANLKYWDDQVTPEKQTVERQENREVGDGYAGLNASSKVIKDPANAQTAGGAAKIPLGDGSGKLAASWGGNASTLATLNGSVKVVEQPASITDHLTGTPADAEVTKAPTSDWAYDHENDADPHTGYRLESADHTHVSTGLQAGKIDHGNALNGLGDNDHTQYILHSLATVANDFLVASGSGTFAKKTLAETGAILEDDIDHGNIQGLAGDDHTQYHNESRHDTDDHSSERAAAATLSGNKHFNGEVTMDVMLADGDHRGLQHSVIAGVGGVADGDAVKFDATGKIIKRAGVDDKCIGISCVAAAADAAAYFSWEGVHKVVWVSGKEPTSNGQNVFLENSPANHHKWSTDVQNDGLIYTGVAFGTGASAKVMLIPGQRIGFE